MRPPDWLARTAATVPDRLALLAGGERLTYAALDRRVDGAARALASLGVSGQSPVAAAVEPSLDSVVLLHAISRQRAVAVPLDPRLPLPERERRAQACDATLLPSDIREITSERPGAGEVAPASAAASLDAVHSVIHTSGTTGTPKPVRLTYGNHLWSALGSAARIGVHASDRWLCSLPLHHVGGLAIVLRSAIYGTAIVLERFEARRVADLIDAERITVASLVATTLTRLLDQEAQLSSLRCALVGGGAAPSGLIERALDAGVPLAPTYGLTEAASQVTTLPPGEARRRPGSAGTAILPTEVRVVAGGIEVRGPTVAPAAAGPEGWLRTGDLGRLDDDGHLYVLGRADEMIVSGGENVSPDRVESALLEHPAVADAAVAGAADAEWQQAVVATVVLHESGAATEAALRAFCRQRLAPHEVPKRIAFAERLPRDAQGKLRRHELPSRHGDG